MKDVNKSQELGGVWRGCKEKWNEIKSMIGWRWGKQYIWRMKETILTSSEPFPSLLTIPCSCFSYIESLSLSLNTTHLHLLQQIRESMLMRIDL